MEYIIIENANKIDFDIQTNSFNFIESFPSYEDAKETAEEYGLKDYQIYGLCTDERNHLI